jgi:hypothetical protein
VVAKLPEATTRNPPSAGFLLPVIFNFSGFEEHQISQRNLKARHAIEKPAAISRLRAKPYSSDMERR